MPPPADDRTTSNRWAPLWVYLVVLLGANFLRSWLIPTGHLPAIVAVGIALGQAAILFVAITAAWRVSRTVGDEPSAQREASSEPHSRGYPIRSDESDG